MKPVIDILEEKISAVMAVTTGDCSCAAFVRPATDARFGDYQVNGVMTLAKKLKTNPRELAQKILANLDISDICETPEIAGPGFINLKIKNSFIAEKLTEINSDEKRLAIEKDSKPKKIVVDFSGPNIAKQMHVGHLRSTIIGDCICRLLEFEGYEVIRQNHIGDWGTQFGMLVELLKEKTETSGENLELEDLEAFYRQASEKYKNDETFAAKARNAIAGLHKGEPEYLNLWQTIVDESKKHYQEIYNLLGIKFEKKDFRGESFYRDMLPDVVNELKQKGLAVESEGAICVFPPGFKTKEGNPLPMIIQKSDGAFLYATTDLAALRYRVQELKADRIIYVTDSRQALHFEMVFAVAKMAGWAKDTTELVHVTFGSVLGEDGKPLKTRSGENVKLKELLYEAVQRAIKVVEDKNPELNEKQKDQIAKAVGIGAVKYADYANNRTSDYIFSFDKMLAMEGNTAPYMQYAYARVQSIDRKAQQRGIAMGTGSINLTEPAELDLAKHLIRYAESIESAKADYKPNYLTSYLYDLAQKFSVFYTNCPVLNAPEEKRFTRWLLCDLTARTIRHGLNELLGIEVVEQM